MLVLISLSARSQTKEVVVKEFKVNPRRIDQRLTELAQSGRQPNGQTARVAFTPADIQGRAYFIGLMKKAGLSVSVDHAGNIIGKRKGKNPAKKPIAFGSHIDMVPDGGKYDGAVGSVGALEVIEVLNENNIITQHPLEVIIFADEEGGTIGSSAIVRPFSSQSLKELSQSGLTYYQGIKAIGGNPDSLNLLVRKKGDLAAFIELHIEQGAILEKENTQIGIVEGIVGIERWDVTIEGVANHAGTTPMNMRNDALLAAAKLILAINETVTGVEGRQVGTVGKVEAQPGAYNVIPDKVILGMELRDLSDEKIFQLFREVERRAKDIATSSGTKISFKQRTATARPSLAAKLIQDNIEKSAKTLGYSYKYMQSGAGHDSQNMALIAPMGMIFIPSVGGISHSPKEFTSANDVVNGVSILLQTIMAIDKE